MKGISDIEIAGGLPYIDFDTQDLVVQYQAIIRKVASYSFYKLNKKRKRGSIAHLSHYKFYYQTNPLKRNLGVWFKF